MQPLVHWSGILHTWLWKRIGKMLQAILDETNVVVTVNNWEHSVGIPCDEYTQIGMLWTGTEFVRHPNDIIKELNDAVEAHLDDVVRTKFYRSIESCCSYKDSTNPQYAAEATSAIAWRDAVWEYYVQVINDYKNDVRPAPTPEELIAELPTLVW